MAQRGPFSSSQPATFSTVPADVVAVNYLTVVVRNQRIRQVGGTGSEPVLVRYFIDEQEWAELMTALPTAFHGRGDVDVRFVGEGVDPWGTPSDDEEALELSQSLAVVVTFEGDRIDEMRRAAERFLSDNELDNCWFLVTRPDDALVVLPESSGG